jgi:hypothetical protein
MGVQTEAGQASRDRIMAALRLYRKEHHYLPTVTQVAEMTGIQRTAVVWHLEKMREQKVLTYEDGNMSRSIRLL